MTQHDPYIGDVGRLIDKAASLVEAARKAGADSADAVLARGRSLSVAVREGQLEDNQSAEGDQLGLRVFVGRGSAIVSSNNAQGNNVSLLAERAVAMARLAPEDRFAGLADPAQLARNPRTDLALFDPGILSQSALEARALETEAAALGVAGVSKSGGAHAACSAYASVLVTSDGFAGAYQRSSFSVSATAIAGEGTAMHRDSDMSVKIHDADLDSAEKIGTSAGMRAVAGLHPRKLETQRVPVIFDRRASSSLVGHLTAAINGASIARKTSFLAGKIGEKLFTSAICIEDDPLSRLGLRSRPFDDEGLEGGRMRLVEDGVLKSYILDCATARELGLASTGHASRGASSAPSPAASNVTLTPGARSVNDMMRDLGKGLLVTQLIGSGVNLVTGDYSRGCWGFWFENGAIQFPVAEITIAGHLSTMFRNLEAADDLELKFSVNAPSCYVGEMTLGGR